MGRKGKYSKELKIEICKKYIDGKGSMVSLAKEIGTAEAVVPDVLESLKLLVSQLLNPL